MKNHKGSPPLLSLPYAPNPGIGGTLSTPCGQDPLPLLGTHSRECPRKRLLMDAHCVVTHTSPKVTAECLATDEWTTERDCPHHETLLGYRDRSLYTYAIQIHGCLLTNREKKSHDINIAQIGKSKKMERKTVITRSCDRRGTGLLSGEDTLKIDCGGAQRVL